MPHGRVRDAALRVKGVAAAHGREAGSEHGGGGLLGAGAAETAGEEMYKG